LYVAISWLGQLFGLLRVLAFEPWNGQPWLPVLLGLGAYLAVPIAVAVILWRLAPWIADCMLADVEDQQAPPSTINREEAQLIAISVLGLLLLCEGIPGIVALIANYLYMAGTESSLQDLFRHEFVKFLSTSATQIGLGLWLFMGARGFVRVFQRFNAPKPEGDQD
jgi:hypothetical protein